jgi:RNA polymerase sigma-70 factor, ECF subfamily
VADLSVPGPLVADPSTTGAAAPQDLARLLKSQRRRLVAHLAHGLGLAHLGLAEDAVQAASLRALETWPVDGTPANPAGWLFRVARHQAIDHLRRQGRTHAWHEIDTHTDIDGEVDTALAVLPPAGRLAGELDDEELALLFAACHPRLPAQTQVALALRALCGLDLATIADGLFSTEAALAQRLARARSALAGASLVLPAGHELAPRREAVLTALLLMFHAGQQASGRQGDHEPASASPHDPLAMCWESIRLARAVAAHAATADPAADALAALLLLHGARLTGRLDAAGDIIPLPGQPRDRWDQGLVRLGFDHLQRAQRAATLSRWHLMAGIAAEHAAAPSYDATDWAAIVGYYGRLLALDPSAAPRLGHAIALAEGGNPADALQRLQALLPEAPAALQAHTWAAIARAQERLDQLSQALHSLDQAIARVRHAADGRLLQRRRNSLAARRHTS